MEATLPDSDGTAKPLVMGCYGMGTAGCWPASNKTMTNAHSWPVSVAPFQVHLVSLGTNNPQVVSSRSALPELLDGGFDVLYDDRAESAGSSSMMPTDRHPCSHHHQQRTIGQIALNASRAAERASSWLSALNCRLHPPGIGIEARLHVEFSG